MYANNSVGSSNGIESKLVLINYTHNGRFVCYEIQRLPYENNAEQETGKDPARADDAFLTSYLFYEEGTWF